MDGESKAVIRMEIVKAVLEKTMHERRTAKQVVEDAKLISDFVLE